MATSRNVGCFLRLVEDEIGQCFKNVYTHAGSGLVNLDLVTESIR